jgi:O-succinylbenzoic acid--CoA ligase
VLAALRPDEPLESDEVAVVVPTSGSTGEPKGALLTATNLLSSAGATHRRLGGPGQWLLALPTTHVGGLMVLVRSCAAGTEPVQLVGPTTVEAFEAATARLTAARRYVSLVPTQLRRLVASPALLEYDAVLLGGAAAPADLLDRAREAGVRVVTTYGMSETSGGCVYDGVPLPGVTVDAPAGRVRIAGPVVALGYRLRPDLTAKAFADGFRTDDLGEVGPDGRLVVHGRADDVVVTGGVKVAPGAVEAVLARHPAVAEVAVAGAPGRRVGRAGGGRGRPARRRDAHAGGRARLGRRGAAPGRRAARAAGRGGAAAARVRQDRPDEAAAMTSAALWLEGARPRTLPAALAPRPGRLRRRRPRGRLLARPGAAGPGGRPRPAGRRQLRQRLQRRRPRHRRRPGRAAAAGRARAPPRPAR